MSVYGLDQPCPMAVWRCAQIAHLWVELLGMLGRYSAIARYQKLDFDDPAFQYSRWLLGDLAPVEAAL